MPRKGKPFARPPAIIEEALAKPMISRCGRCGWRATGTASEMLKEFKRHPCVADREAVTA
jgi:hypothetical protein